MIGRGLRRRCGRCGARGLFDSWFRLKERCPRCGYRFAREEGFFTGVYLINIAVTEGAMFVALMVFIVVRGVANWSFPLLPILLATAVAAIVVPILFYPFAATTWAAMDLAMRPLEPIEEAEAIVVEEEARHSRSPPDGSAGGAGDE
jgi:uncharacterized protein (DUF983 family)